MSHVRPLRNLVLIARQKASDVTKGGIVLPGTAQEKQNEGEVLAVGPGRRLDNGKLLKVDLMVGDIVIFGKYGGTEFKNGDQILMSEDDILAVKI